MLIAEWGGIHWLWAGAVLKNSKFVAEGKPHITISRPNFDILKLLKVLIATDEL